MKKFFGNRYLQFDDLPPTFMHPGHYDFRAETDAKLPENPVKFIICIVDTTR